MAYNSEIDALQIQQRMLLSNLTQLHEKALKLKQSAANQHEKQQYAADMAAADYDHMDNAIDDGVFEDVKKVEDIAAKFERIANDLKTLIDHVKP